VPSEPTHSHNGLGPRSLARVLGLDVGSKRIGLAISDPLGITAQGLETLHRQNKRLDFAQLEKVIHDYEVTEIVVGYPLRMSGAASQKSCASVSRCPCTSGMNA
jgi:putative Holliday junction resolvase